MNLKVVVKVYREGSYSWTHFCYLPKEIMKLVRSTKISLFEKIVEWSLKDFGTDPRTWEGLEQLREAIKIKYKSQYPELFMDSVIDRQGWLRVWCSEHIKEEYENVKS